MTHFAASSYPSLRHIGLFSEIDDEEMTAISQRCRWQSFEKGQRILDKGSRTREVYFVVQGHATIVTYSPGGKEITLAIAGPGDFFGELAAIDERPRSASAVAIDALDLGIMSHEIFLEVMRRYPSVALKLLTHLAHLVRNSGMRILELSTLPAAQRVYATLLRMSQKDAAVPQLWVIRPLPPMHEIASLTSTTRETVSRSLSQLYPTGIVKKKGRNLYIMDRQKLTDLVQSIEAYTSTH
ncbi:MAG TPA: Crp/Fnr family transcriptional regulator [Dongiaceae bacterium]|jgi:CRP-like cAMP-binding protein|nr:Crp/Fnr family transcriptional regulator [Dongiaceae bacterium]